MVIGDAERRRSIGASESTTCDRCTAVIVEHLPAAEGQQLSRQRRPRSAAALILLKILANRLVGPI